LHDYFALTPFLLIIRIKIGARKDALQGAQSGEGGVFTLTLIFPARIN
jgi:hypothetical protein